MDRPRVRGSERLMRTLEGQGWLDKPGYKIEHGCALLLNLLGPAREPIQNLLHGLWFGHPLHPAITGVPIGSWTAAAVLDVLALRSTAPTRYAAAARVVIGIGVLTAVAAAVTGLNDWQYTHDNARRAGLAHAILNTGALALYGRSWWRRRQRVGGRPTAFVGYLMVLGGGYLGGRLTYRHLIGTDRQADVALWPLEWCSVLQDDELAEGSPRRVRVGQLAIALVRSNGRVHAFAESCPHLGGPLSEGWLEDDAIVCPWHGSRFELDSGTNVTGPATAPAARFEVRRHAGWIQVRRVPPVVTAPPGSAVAYQQARLP